MAEVNQTHPGKPIFDEVADVPRSHNTFDLSYRLSGTMPFNIYYPHLAFEAVEGDRVRFRSAHNLQSYTLKAPLMSNIKQHKEYFSCYKEAILPFNYDKVHINPTIGDDAPIDANTVDEHFYSRHLPVIYSLIHMSDFWEMSFDGTSADYHKLTSAFRQLILAELFFSDGSLLNVLGCNLSGIVRCYLDGSSEDIGFDGYFQYFLDAVKQVVPLFYVDVVGIDGRAEGNPKLVLLRNDFNISVTAPDAMNYRSFLEFIRENPNFILSDASSLLVDSEVPDFDRFASDYYPDSDPAKITLYFQNGQSDEPFNFGRVAAYQIICSHFYSNDSVDYVYSAELYRESIHSLLHETLTFEYNGINCPYDYLSGHVFNYFLDGIEDTVNYETALYLVYLFGYRRSLRFVDYFTAAKTRPLAVGNTTVAVDNNQVDVVDVTRKLQMQRFLNAVNRFGRKFSQYTKGLFGVLPAQDFHNPAMLASTYDDVNPSALQNTSSEQLTEETSVTSTLHADSSNYEFTYYADREAYIIGITFFDIMRNYAWSTDRQFFHKDRFDDFNPFMQFVGDQPVKGLEVNSRSLVPTFGYASRYIEYKMRVSRATGGFVRNLPGWTFVADNAPGIWFPSVISPEYIRSSCVELDDFYVKLSGYTLGNYFHFIVTFDNFISADRDMVYQSSIL